MWETRVNLNDGRPSMSGTSLLVLFMISKTPDASPFARV